MHKLYAPIMADFNTSIIAVFRVLAYDCSVCAFFSFVCLTLSNKSCYIVLDIVIDVKTCEKCKTLILQILKLKQKGVIKLRISK